MSFIVTDPEQSKLVEKWRLRHAFPDAIGMWAITNAPESRAFAFNAIAQDPRILHRAARPNAAKMAVHAEDFALSVAQSDAATSDTWRAAALFVQRSIDAWRQSLRAGDRHSTAIGVSTSTSAARDRLQDPWEIARRNFPHVDDETGRLTTRILHELGIAALAHVRKPWDHVIILGVLRFAARQLRGEPRGEPGFSRQATIETIQSIQSYIEANRLSPLRVPYSGPGKPAQQALDLLRDARTLRDAACATADGDETRTSIWQRAIDLHAFAVVALDPRALLNLPLNEAYQIAAAAIRQAEAAMQTPVEVEMPLLPFGRALAPRVVVLHARACLPHEGSGPSE